MSSFIINKFWWFSVDFGVRFARFAAGDSQFQHRGSQPFVFNAVDGATIFFQTSGTNRMFVNSTGLLPGNNNVHSLGSSSNRWTEVWAANGTIQTSDERTKQNIDDSPYGLAEIMELRPVTFEWKDSPEYGQKVGLIAQEVQPIIKEVVRTQTVRVTKEGQRTLEDTELMGLNYAELVPILVKAIQEQQVVIENQKLELDELKAKFAIVDQLANELQDLKDKLGNTEIIHLGEVITKQEVELRDLASVNQNQPNPFNQNTSISYYLPEEVSRATLVISDINGRILKEVILEGRGKGILETKAGELQSGTYTYSLVVDGKIVDTKKMILTK